MTKATERIIYNNYDLYEKYTDEELTQIAVEDGYTLDEIDDELLTNLRYDADAIDYETAKHELDYFFGDKEVIFFGTLGLWYGRCAGGKTGKFNELFNAAIADCDYIKIYEKNGHLYLECSHHDGTNEFEIKLINERGKQYLENWEYGPYTDKRTLEDVHRAIVKRYSVRPQFCKTVWGV